MTFDTILIFHEVNGTFRRVAQGAVPRAGYPLLSAVIQPQLLLGDELSLTDGSRDMLWVVYRRIWCAEPPELRIYLKCTSGGPAILPDRFRKDSAAWPAPVPEQLREKPAPVPVEERCSESRSEHNRGPYCYFRRGHDGNCSWT